MNALRYRVVPRGCKVAAGSVRVAIPLDSRDHFGLIQTLPLEIVQQGSYHVYYEAAWHPPPQASYCWNGTLWIEEPDPH
ncbi:MAG: hypothetical protein N2047_03940 [Meiothermus sp.]|jgi:hypothetical protein|nr:hypothetical protein [Meiothermus sp.]